MRLKRFWSRSAALTSAFLAVALAAGCGGGSSTKTATGGKDLEKKSITVATLTVVDAAGLHIAVAKKLFEAEGLSVKVQPVATSLVALPALKNGQIDVMAGGNLVSFVQAHASGAMKLSILADAAAAAPRSMAALVPKDSPIKLPKDLEGKTVGVHLLNNVQSLTFNEVLKANNVDPTKIKYVQVLLPNMGAALQQHQVDAVLTVEPFGSDIQRKLGANMLLDSGGPPVTGLPLSGYVATQDWVAKYPKTAAAFQRAIQKAQQLASSDRKQVETVLPGYAKIDAQTASVLSLPGYPTSTNPARLQRLIDLMVQDGLLKSKIDAKTVIFTPPAG